MTAAAVLEGVCKKRQVIWRRRHGGVAAPGRPQDLADQAVARYGARVSEIDDRDFLEPRRGELIDPRPPVHVPVSDHQVDALAALKVGPGLVQRAERIDAGET